MSADKPTVDTEFLKRRLADLESSINKQSASMSNAGIPGYDSGSGEGPTMSDDGRIGRLEGEVSGLKHGQTQLLVAVGLVAAFVIGFGFYTIQRLDVLNEKVNDLPSKIGSELRDITKTLANSITAAKQQPPQIILMPTPGVQQQAPIPPQPPTPPEPKPPQ